MSYIEKILRIDKQFLPFQRIPHTQLWALAGFPFSEGIVREYMERSMWGGIFLQYIDY